MDPRDLRSLTLLAAALLVGGTAFAGCVEQEEAQGPPPDLPEEDVIEPVPTPAPQGERAPEEGTPDQPVLGPSEPTENEAAVGP